MLLLLTVGYENKMDNDLVDDSGLSAGMYILAVFLGILFHAVFVLTAFLDLFNWDWCFGEADNGGDGNGDGGGTSSEHSRRQAKTTIGK